MNELSSLFIDNELNLDEKKDFVDIIHNNRDFYEETVELIEQEKILVGDEVYPAPLKEFHEPSARGAGFFKSLLRPMGLSLAATAALLLVFWTVRAPRIEDPPRMNRFVIYRPDASRVEITGSFTGWEKVPLHEVGESGYWEITLELPRGVHRFTYILDGRTPFADPTVLACENDDFGGVDSIINTEI